jgi:hypothetical protein
VRHDTKHIRASKKRRTSENAIWANFGESPLDELRRITLPRALVNKGERMSCWENTGRDEGSVLIMGITQSVGKREVECE